jgi:4'-phosphopantetheinyl transferase
MREMKAAEAPRSSSDIADPQDEAARIKAKLRKFYTHWALKEAYIKMTGEALLADWLRELEFRDVVAPPVSEEGAWGTVVWSSGYVRGEGGQGAGGGEREEEGFEVLFKGSRVRGVTMGVRFLGREWIVATCVRGGGGTGLGKEEEEEWNELTIQDIEPCAKGVCRCLG